jgi:hypothetical protein
MFGRRRPLARAAVVGGAGYAIGKRRARYEQEQYDQGVADAQYQQAAAPAAPAPTAGGITNDTFAELERLGKLLEDGILTQAEFDAKKTQILNS